MDPTDMMAGALAGGAPPGAAGAGMPPPPQMPGMPGAGGPPGMPQMGPNGMKPFGGMLSPMGGGLLQHLMQGGGQNSLMKLLQQAQPQSTMPGPTPPPMNPGQPPQAMQ